MRPAGADTLRLTTGFDYAPYASPDLPNGGVITETVTRVLTEMGYNSQLQFYPWKRGFQRIISGSSDITFPYAKHNEREKHAYYSRPVNRITIRLFYNKLRKVQFDSAEDLVGLVYCEPLGYQTEPVLEQLIKDGRLDRAEAQTMDNCFQLLAQHHVDFLATNDLVAHAAGRRALGSRAEDLIRAADNPLHETYEYMIVSHKHPDGAEIVRRFNDAYGKLYDQGVIQEIWRRHVGDTIKPPA